MYNKEKKFKFIDLFSGIGGFHQAMKELGGECVFASEIDPYAIETYQKNYGIDSNINIRDINEKEIPKHDVLCGGFPCQTFSKAGKRKGMSDTRGTLFFEIERILRYHKTKYIVLENVRNLISHDKGNTWNTIYTHLKEMGYRLTPRPIIISPHQLGIPQLRERVVILGIYDPKNADKDLHISFDDFKNKDDNDAYSIITKKRVAEKYYINRNEEYILTAWDEFYKGINEKTIGFPIWADYFKMTKIDSKLPKWKYDFIIKNKNLYNNNKEFIDKWLNKYDNLSLFTPTQRKMEWQAGESIQSLWEGIIQFRPSGIRVKKPTCFPALVAMVQIPIIGKYKRRLTVEETAKLQSFPTSFKPNNCDQQAYKQFGNAVNVDVIKTAAKKLFDYDKNSD